MMKDIDRIDTTPRMQRCVYVSLGTRSKVNKETLELFHIIISQIEKRKLKANIFSNNLDIKSRSTKVFLNYVDQLEMLKNSFIFISHGGMNSVCESILMRTPMIIIPQSNEDQFVNAEMVKNYNLGVTIQPKYCDSKAIGKALDKIIDGYDFYLNSLTNMRKKFINSDNYKIFNKILLDLSPISK